MPQTVVAAVVVAYSVGLIKPAEFLHIRRLRRVEFRWALIALAGVGLLGTLKGILVAVIASLVALAHQAYNRAGVERVMGFCTEEQAKKFLSAVPLVEKAIVDSGVILIKYWLEVSPEEQTRRLEARINDGRKIWKLSPMDLKSYSRWYDYTRARDDMFSATDTGFAPWYVADSNDKKRARLNIISHLLSKIPYKRVPREKVRLPERQKAGGYKEPDYAYKFVEKRH